MLTPLLATKLYIPPARANRVSRSRLIEQLNTLRPLTLIAAPAGFGKTTLLSDWIPQSEHCVTWLSIDKEDNGPIRFWVYVVATLQKLRINLGESTLTLLQWYRYHHLFAEVLRARLQQTQADLTPELHRRASKWYEQGGQLADAVNHALVAQAFDRAAILLE